MAVRGVAPAARRLVVALVSGRGGSKSFASFSGEKDFPGEEPFWVTDKKQFVESQWRAFFSDPAQWWDHRSGKDSPKHPDFKHKRTKDALWVDGKWRPPWVDSELAAMPHGSVPWNIFSWNKKLLSLASAGKYEKVMDHYEKIRQEGVIPDRFTFPPVLNACAGLKALDLGVQIHAHIVESGCDADAYVCSSLIDMYAKCGSIQRAWGVFHKMGARDVTSWNAMIQGLVKSGLEQRALELFHRMRRQGVDPDSVTFVAVLNGCARAGALHEGRRVHGLVRQRGFERDAFVRSSLVDMYAKCGSIDEARRVFYGVPSRSVVAWNALILGHVKCGEGVRALELFEQMQREDVEPEPNTFVAVLNACSSVSALEEGKRVHEQIVERGFESLPIVGNSLVDMYAKCGSMEDALRLFDKMGTRDAYGWSAMVRGYVKSGRGDKALELSRRMGREGVKPDAVTLVGMLGACSSVSALEEGRLVHEQIRQTGCEADVFVGTSLVNMHAKCGSIDDAVTVFNQMYSGAGHNFASWNAMLGGFAMHGQGMAALLHFERMCWEGVEMDEGTFVSLLSACGYEGLVDEGLQCFQELTGVYGIRPAMEHYACVVDLLGRAGRLHEALDFVKTMPLEVTSMIWASLLAACRFHGCAGVGRNWVGVGGNWVGRSQLQQQSLENSVKKEPGRTWIEVNNEVHTFIAADQEHPRIEEIHSELERLSRKMKAEGYVLDTRFVLHSTEEEERLGSSCHHGEKLAIAFALISTPPGSPIRLFKNRRVCADCHSAAQFIGKMERRTIVLRDSKRFHHFENGCCSCGSYW